MRFLSSLPTDLEAILVAASNRCNYDFMIWASKLEPDRKGELDQTPSRDISWPRKGGWLRHFPYCTCTSLDITYVMQSGPKSRKGTSLTLSKNRGRDSPRECMRAECTTYTIWAPKRFMYCKRHVTTTDIFSGVFKVVWVRNNFETHCDLSILFSQSLWRRSLGNGLARQQKDNLRK